MLIHGDIVDERFEVIALIGSGGLADVYKVRHLELGSVYALKLLTWRRAKLAERMVLEGRIQAQLKHPNIVSVVDLVRHEGQVGLLMEFVDGDTLEGLMLQGPIPVDVALRLFAGVLSAVDTAHRAGVLHRDLKPANVMMAQSGSTVTPKVADFGLAKVVMDTAAGLTKSGMTMGTPGYLAPEQLSDASTAGIRADIFALGIILHEMLTGQRAYALGPEGHVAVHATANESIADLATAAPHVPAHVAAAIARAADRDPEARFATCAAFAHALYDQHPSLLEPFTGSASNPAVSLSLSATSSQVTPKTSASGTTYQGPVTAAPGTPGASRALWVVAVFGALGAVAVAALVLMVVSGALPSSTDSTPAADVAPTDVQVVAPASGAGTEAPSEPSTPDADPVPATDTPTEEAAETAVVDPVPVTQPEPVQAPPPEPMPVEPVVPAEPAPVPSPEVDPEPDPTPVVEPQPVVQPEPDVANGPPPQPAVEPEPVAPPPMPYPSLEGTWLGTAGRQRMSLWLGASDTGNVTGTLTLNLGPTVRTESVVGSIRRDGRVTFTAGDLSFSGAVRGDAVEGTYTSAGRDRRFEWSARR